MRYRIGVQSASASSQEEARLVRDALRVLQVQRLVLAIHDVSFPLSPDEDLGCGSPYSVEAQRFLTFVRNLGFSAVQLGPQGQTSRVNPSPYDGSIFGKNLLALAPKSLAARWPGLLSMDDVASAMSNAGRTPDPDRADHAVVWKAAEALWRQMHARFKAAPDRYPDIVASQNALLSTSLQQVPWAMRGAVFADLADRYGTEDWRVWPVPDRDRYRNPSVAPDATQTTGAGLPVGLGDVGQRFLFTQAVLKEQHQALRHFVSGLGLQLYGDLQAGMGHRDVYCWQHLLWSEYLMGAPPSRTNPEGQPWGYPVIHPDLLGTPADPGLGLQLVRTRVDELLQAFDGLRIDHPHALVYPWVYRADDRDPYHAVRRGARLWASPNLPDHPLLARLSLVRPEQIDPRLPRHADGWVCALTDDQVTQFGRVLQVVLDGTQAAGRRVDDVACEVLSTWPFPLRAVMARHGLGRFVVTQKVDPGDPDDIYRSDRTGPQDWIMLGNHDTWPLQRLLETWRDGGQMPDRARYLAERLEPAGGDRAGFAARIAEHPGRFADAMFAELFAAPAGNVSIFFSDLLGLREIYNRVGVVHPDNWTLRVPHAYQEIYAQKRPASTVANLPRGLALALRSKRDPTGQGGDLIALANRLETLGGGPL